jgi:transcription elongation factor Elf1
MNATNRKQLQQKTEFNNWSISMLSTIFRCSKCKKNNTILKNTKSQKCIFCGNPNYT